MSYHDGHVTSSPPGPGDGDQRATGSLPTTEDQTRRRERRWLRWFALGTFLLIVVALVAGVLVARAQDTGPDEPLGAGMWALLIGVPLAVLVLAAAIGFGFAWWRRRRGSSLFARSPLWELPTQKQRRHLVRVLRRGQPVDPAQHDLAVRVARDLTRRRALVWLYLATATLQVLNVVVQEGGARWLSLATVVLFLGSAGYWAWLIHRMRIAADRLEAPR